MYSLHTWDLPGARGWWLIWDFLPPPVPLPSCRHAQTSVTRPQCQVGIHWICSVSAEHKPDTCISYFHILSIIDIDTTRAVNATSHSRWPCFSSGRCTGLECIAFVGQNIVDVLGVLSPAENTAIQGIIWRTDMIALSICCTALTANFDITFCTVPLQHFFCDSVTIILIFIIIIIIIIIIVWTLNGTK